MTPTRALCAHSVPARLLSRKNVWTMSIFCARQKRANRFRHLKNPSDKNEPNSMTVSSQPMSPVFSQALFRRQTRCGRKRVRSSRPRISNSCFSVPAYGDSIVSMTKAMFITSRPFHISASAFSPVALLYVSFPSERSFAFLMNSSFAPLPKSTSLS